MAAQDRDRHLHAGSRQRRGPPRVWVAPRNALLTVGTGSGISSSGAAGTTIKTTGNVFSASSISLGGTVINDTLHADYAITAKGALLTYARSPIPPPASSPWFAVNTRCNAPATVPQINDGNDPQATDVRYTSRLADVPKT